MFEREFLEFLIQPPGPNNSEFPLTIGAFVFGAFFAWRIATRSNNRPWASIIAILVCISLAGLGITGAYTNRWDRYQCLQGGSQSALELGRRGCLWKSGRPIYDTAMSAHLQQTEYERVSGHPRVQNWQITHPDQSTSECVANVNLYCDVVVSVRDTDRTLYSELRIYGHQGWWPLERDDKVFDWRKMASESTPSTELRDAVLTQHISVQLTPGS